MTDTAIRIKNQEFASKGGFFGFYFYYAGRKAGLS
jgi:hypothetical protein